MKGNKTALLFAANGITENAEKEIIRLASNIILCITKNDLMKLKTSTDCKKLILEKWNKLHKKIANELPF